MLKKTLKGSIMYESLYRKLVDAPNGNGTSKHRQLVVIKNTCRQFGCDVNINGARVEFCEGCDDRCRESIEKHYYDW